LNFFVSRIILGTLFFMILFPISLLYKIPNKDNLLLKRSDKSTWIKRNHKYTSGDLENIWWKQQQVNTHKLSDLNFLRIFS
jgi:hypothetical protein